MEVANDTANKNKHKNQKCKTFPLRGNLSFPTHYSYFILALNEQIGIMPHRLSKWSQPVTEEALASTYLDVCKSVDGQQ